MAYTLTFDYGYDDFAALIKAKRSLGLMGALGPATPYIVVSALYLLFMVASLAYDGMPFAEMLRAPAVFYILVGIPLVIALVAIINFLFARLAFRPVFKRFALADKEVTISLDETGVTWTGGGLSGACPWANVKWIVETKDRLFLFISKVEAVVLPRRAVSSDREFQALAAYAREHIHG